MVNELSTLLIRELEAVRREILLFPDDEMLWAVLPGITNSAGNLALHLAGNIQHFIGTVLGGTGYVRDREGELQKRSGRRNEVVIEIEKAIVVVRTVLPGLTADQLDDEFPQAPGGMRVKSRLFLIHLSVHAAYHLGQLGYLRRALANDSRTSGALSLQPLAIR